MSQFTCNGGNQITVIMPSSLRVGGHMHHFSESMCFFWFDLLHHIIFNWIQAADRRFERWISVQLCFSYVMYVLHIVGNASRLDDFGPGSHSSIGLWSMPTCLLQFTCG